MRASADAAAAVAPSPPAVCVANRLVHTDSSVVGGLDPVLAPGAWAFPWHDGGRHCCTRACGGRQAASSTELSAAAWACGREAEGPARWRRLMGRPCTGGWHIHWAPHELVDVVGGAACRRRGAAVQPACLAGVARARAALCRAF